MKNEVKISGSIPGLLLMAGFWVLLGGIDLADVIGAALVSGTPVNWNRTGSGVVIYVTSWLVLTIPIYRTVEFTVGKSWILKITLLFFAGLIFGFFHRSLMLGGLVILNKMVGTTQSSMAEFICSWMPRFKATLFKSMLAFWEMAIVLVTIEYYKKYRTQAVNSSELKLQLSEARLQALRMQLQPHFLFNTLNTITMSIRNGNKEESIKIISVLSDLLRDTMASETDQRVTLSTELTIIKRYLDIELIRHEDRLQVTYAIASETLSLTVPNFLLQPLVENAFKHGINKTISPSVLAITTFLRNEELIIEVYNEGPFLAGDVQSISKDRIGLKNTIERLEKHYEKNCSFNISDFEKGVKVVIRLPAQKIE